VAAGLARDFRFDDMPSTFPGSTPAVGTALSRFFQQDEGRSPPPGIAKRLERLAKQRTTLPLDSPLDSQNGKVLPNYTLFGLLRNFAFIFTT
jgi:hypothetical protein